MSKINTMQLIDHKLYKNLAILATVVSIVASIATIYTFFRLRQDEKKARL